MVTCLRVQFLSFYRPFASRNLLLNGINFNSVGNCDRQLDQLKYKNTKLFRRKTIWKEFCVPSVLGVNSHGNSISYEITVQFREIWVPVNTKTHRFVIFSFWLYVRKHFAYKLALSKDIFCSKFHWIQVLIPELPKTWCLYRNLCFLMCDLQNL